MLAPSDDHAMPGPNVIDSRLRSRRAVLAAAAGGAAAIAAAMARPARAEAASGSALIIGSPSNNAGTGNTILSTSSSVVAFELIQNGPGTALMGYVTPATGGTRGVYGRTDSPDGDGVQARNAGTAGMGAAVRAFGGNNPGVVATSVSEAVMGTSMEGTGVHGASTNGPGVFGSTVNGGWAVYGATDSQVGVRGQSVSSIGVHGVSTSSIAVYGVSGTGPGVRGESTSDHGVVGTSASYHGVTGSSTSGIGVYGETSSGYAGYFAGKTRFDSFQEFSEAGAPATPPANVARLFVRDSGGKTQLCIVFSDGVVQVLAAQP